MNNSNSSTKNVNLRSTLKLKVAARPTREQITTPPHPRPQSNKAKTNARWDDEHKARMQAEMDALAR